MWNFSMEKDISERKNTKLRYNSNSLLAGLEFFCFVLKTSTTDCRKRRVFDFISILLFFIQLK